MKKASMLLLIVILIVGIFALAKHFLSIQNISSTPTQVQSSETQLVEKYIRENIKALTPDDPVLGGNWYLVSLNINSDTNSGEMTYEDGHIQGTAIFTYTISGTQIALHDIKKVK